MALLPLLLVATPAHAFQVDPADLDDLPSEVPGSSDSTLSADDWIIGFKVGDLVLAGELDAALESARECEASPWWCAALSGFVLHQLRQFSEAEAAFDSAIRLMNRAARCEWSDEMRRYLLDRSLRRALDDPECTGTSPTELRFWWLADPFYLMPGNDRRTEHFARLVAMRFHHRVLAREGGTCAVTHHLAQIKQGWPSWWWASHGPITSIAPGPGYRFIPTSEQVLRPRESSVSQWSLEATSFSERYRPAYGPVFELAQQVAFFLRGDSLVVAAATEFGGTPMALADRAEVGLVLARDYDDFAIYRQDSDSDHRARFRATVPADRYFVSVEAVTESRGAGRSRFGHGLPDALSEDVALSDLLLFDWSDDLEQTLDVIAPHMLGTSSLQPTRRIGVFWEIYGVEDGQVIEVAIAATPLERGILRRLAEAVRLIGPRETLRFVWRESAGDESLEITGRTLELNLSQLPPGGYALELQVAVEGGGTAMSRRVVELTAR